MSIGHPVVALLGNVDHEGIVSVLKTSGYLYRKKILVSSRENWASIVELLEQQNVHAVLVKLTQHFYSNILDSTYEGVSESLLANIAKKPNLVFIYEDLWVPVDTNSMDDPASWDYRRGELPPSNAMRVLANAKLRDAGIEPICYSTNAQLMIIGAQFLQDLVARLLFRIYIPHGRLYATEVDKLLQLFKEFLDNTGREGITLSKVAAEQGTSFEFCGEYRGGSSLAEDFEDFSQLMEMCVSDVEKARTMLSLKDVDGVQAVKIISRYTKEARRLYLDITHEREMKVLEIRHRLESELTEALPSSTKSETIRTLVDEVIPEIVGLRVISDGSHRALPHQLTINVNPQIIEKVHGLVIREISGNVNLGPDAEQLLKIIGKYGGDRVTELTSDVHEVGDRGVPEGTRITKKQRLKSFLYGLGPEVAKSGVHLLEEYLKSKMK